MGVDAGVIELDQRPVDEVKETIAPGNDLTQVLDRSRMSMLDRYAHDKEAQGAVQFTLGLVKVLSGETDQNPFPQENDTEGKKRIVKMQKELIRTMVRVIEGGQTPDDLTELNDFYTIAGVLESGAKRELPHNLSYERKIASGEARAWWRSIIAEASIITALQYADYDVVIPDTDEVVNVDYLGGTDFLAHKDGRVFAIDAKSRANMGPEGYSVREETSKPASWAVKDMSKRNFGDAPITRAIVAVDPQLAPSLRPAHEPSKQLKNIRNFLTLPEPVEAGFLEDLYRLPLRKGA